MMTMSNLYSQVQELPYREIPNYPEKYTAANVAARMDDGLEFRYYWATEGLRPEDLSFQANKDGRTTLDQSEGKCVYRENQRITKREISK